jgi:hypothetical protein
MDSRPFPEILRIMCRSLDLQIDLSSEESGKAVHEECYTQHVARSSSNPAAALAAGGFRLPWWATGLKPTLLLARDREEPCC